jgi:hypothetical protein
MLMKKLLLISLLLFAGVIFVQAQTQRMVLYEGYSNASCGPCASQNPTTNALIAANPSKVVPIKYQVNWPGSDPMNAQTQTWVGPRVTYYNITGVPATRVDGPASTSVTQTVINTRYAVSSPFFMEVNHTFNAAEDSVFFEVYIEAAQNYSGTSLVLQTAMVEKHIHFASQAGSNGETDFYNVMRKMYPNASGTSLPSSWTLGDDTTFYFAELIPAYIYDFDQIAFVAFIQSNSDKSVQQATKTILDQYVAFNSNNIPQDPGCYTDFAFQLTLINLGKTPITSLDIEYGIVGGTPSTYNWTGNLDFGETELVNLPAITLPGTSVEVYAEIQNPNGGANDSDIGTRVEGEIMTISSYSAVPLTQNFASTTFPPTNWAVVSTDALKWARSAAGSGSARLELYSSPTGQIDYLYMEGLNLTGVSNLILTFDVAHAKYDGTYGGNDRLQVEISTNCGSSWTSIYNKSGNTGLSTAPNTTAQFTPTTAQWRNDTVDLAGYSSQDEILIRFKATSGFGNNLYLDNINLGQNTASINEAEIANNFTVYPNPVSDELNIDFKLSETSDVIINVYDITGKLVDSRSLGLTSQGAHTLSIDVSLWNSGIYQLSITTNSGISTEKFIKN